jgi:pentatricopeptide repeat protein
MRKPLKRPLTEEFEERAPKKFERERKSADHIFIRVDRFEDAFRIFGEMKRKISEIERAIEEIKRVKEKEDQELQSWENELRSLREQVEKVDRDIFSKV